jgi:hypothetical protein
MEKTKIPEAMKVQLSRLFGKDSKEARREQATASEVRNTLKKALMELEHYLEANVDTDELHLLMLYTGIWAASESLKEDQYLFGYIEGITRLALLLMGDYPDHRQRKGGKKKADHYDLKRMRTLTYIQDSNQKLQTLISASRTGFLELSINPYEALREFRKEKGHGATYREFFRWFRAKYPEDYAAIF